jgi:hypothetical protein
VAFKAFANAGNYLVPWVTGGDSDGSDLPTDDSKTYPAYCGMKTDYAITNVE